MNKLASRKFWISVAAFLASIATSIAGLAVSEPTVASVGLICGILAAAIYAACEAAVDKASIDANTTTTAKTISATADSQTIVKNALQSEVEAIKTA